MPDPASPLHDPVSELTSEKTGDVITPWPCATCGYQLLGLSKTGLCPECGTAIEWSLRHRYLLRSDPKWIRRLLRGTIVLWWAEAGSLLLNLLFLASWYSPRTLAMVLRPIVLWPAQLVIAIAYATAVWWLTTRETAGGRRVRQANDAAQRLRGLTAIWATLFCLYVPIRTNGWVGPLELLSMALTGLQVLSTAMLFGHLQRLAVRMPGRPSAGAFGFLKWAMPLSISAGQLLAWVMISASVLVYSRYSAFTLPGRVASTACIVWTLGCLPRFRGGLEMALVRLV